MYKASNKQHLVSYRRFLRNNQTPAELLLWQYLKSGKLMNRKFRRQHSFGNYIYDFYCKRESLVIELDGEYVHDNESINRNDIAKAIFANSLQLRLLRFSNKDVLQNTSAVLQEILRHFTN